MHQYYYKVSGCKGTSAKVPECICWHTEGTGVYEDLRFDTDTTKLWRTFTQIEYKEREMY